MGDSLATVILNISALHEFWVHHYGTTACHWSVMSIFTDSRILSCGYFECNLQFCVVVLVQYSLTFWRLLHLEYVYLGTYLTWQDGSNLSVEINHFQWDSEVMFVQEPTWWSTPFTCTHMGFGISFPNCYTDLLHCHHFNHFCKCITIRTLAS
jgi:hypothetical protein